MTALTVDYIIVQAGGKGTRLGHLTENKPKALVPVENLPMLFHLFRMFPDKMYVIIADFKKEVMREYLSCFAEVKFLIVDAEEEGTCAGVRKALELVPDSEPFMLVWSDLILPGGFSLPRELGDYIGISQSFPCRWSYKDGIFAEERSADHGVAGLFIFRDKTAIEGIPIRGEFVRWLQSREMRFEEVELAGTREYGLLSEYENLETEKCRPFNKMTFVGDKVIKEPADVYGRELALKERRWYDAAVEKGVMNIPKLFLAAESALPEPEASADSMADAHTASRTKSSVLRLRGSPKLVMERIEGMNVYEYESLSTDDKRVILRNLTQAIHALHRIERIPADAFSMKDAYYGKTMGRLRKIRDLVPFSDRRTITVNGRECRNIYYYRRDLERRLDALRCDSFAFIHGDCTFSNLMLKNGAEPVFIDPRGYFGYTELYGDPNYDWAKLYYSIVGNYDRFNLKDFRLSIGDDAIELAVASNGWECLEQDFFEMSGADPQTIKLLHAVIWLSLTTYAWQDYDSICGAFYNGLYYLEEAL